jgi:hypothetical protein
VTMRVRARLVTRSARRARTRMVTARRVRRTTFRLVTPRLGPGRHALRITASDRAGNIQVVPTTLALPARG